MLIVELLLITVNCYVIVIMYIENVISINICVWFHFVYVYQMIIIVVLYCVNKQKAKVLFIFIFLMDLSPVFFLTYVMCREVQKMYIDRNKNWKMSCHLNTCLNDQLSPKSGLKMCTYECCRCTDTRQAHKLQSPFKSGFASMYKFP